jgi:hypothetical protein
MRAQGPIQNAAKKPAGKGFVGLRASTFRTTLRSVPGGSEHARRVFRGIPRRGIGMGLLRDIYFLTTAFSLDGRSRRRAMEKKFQNRLA